MNNETDGVENYIMNQAKALANQRKRVNFNCTDCGVACDKRAGRNTVFVCRKCAMRLARLKFRQTKAAN